jgi:hypothetical protein
VTAKVLQRGEFGRLECFSGRHEVKAQHPDLVGRAVQVSGHHHIKSVLEDRVIIDTSGGYPGASEANPLEAIVFPSRAIVSSLDPAGAAAAQVAYLIEKLAGGKLCAGGCGWDLGERNAAAYCTQCQKKLVADGGSRFACKRSASSDADDSGGAASDDQSKLCEGGCGWDLGSGNPNTLCSSCKP